MHHQERMTIAGLRNLLNEEDQQKLTWMELGWQGENWVLGELKALAMTGWRLEFNLWLGENNTCEVDILVISKKKWLHMEVKNYQGSVTVTEDCLTVNGKDRASNPLHQVQRTGKTLNALTSDLSPAISIESCLVFSHEHCQVTVEESAGGGISIFNRYQFLEYIQKKASEMTGDMSPQQVANIETWLKRYRVDNPFVTRDMSRFVWDQFYPGVTCTSCGSYSLVRCKKSLVCNDCDHRESLSHSLLRMVRHHFLLHGEHHMTLSQLRYFTGDFYYQDYISKLMRKYFDRPPGSPRGHYFISLEKIEEIMNKFD